MQKKTIGRIGLYGGIGLAVIAIISLLTVQQYRIGRLSSQIETRNSELVAEIRDIDTKSAVTEQNVKALAGELNEVLKALRLPESSVTFAEIDQPEESEETANVSVYLKAVDTLIEAWKSEADARALAQVRTELDTRLTSARTTVSKSGALYVRYDGTPVFLVKRRDDESPGTSVSSLDGQEKQFSGSAETLANDISEYIEQSMGEQVRLLEVQGSMMERLSSLFRSGGANNLAESFDLSIAETETDYTIAPVKGYSVVRKGRELVNIFADPVKSAYIVGERTVGSADEVLAAVRSLVESIDIRSPEEMRIDSQLELMRGVIADTGFRNFLASRGLVLVDGGREDSDYYYFDLLSDDGTRFGAFAVQKFIGELYLVDHEDVPILAVKSLADESVKKNW